jgi:peroxiredoxin
MHSSVIMVATSSLLVAAELRVSSLRSCEQKSFQRPDLAPPIAPAILRRMSGLILQPGTTAPNFELKATPDQSVALTDFRGRPVILAFYPADWSPVCSDQMSVYNEVLDEFSAYDAQLIGLSVDGVWCHLAFANSRKLRFPLLADFEPKGGVARSYGAYNAEDGVCERALFVLDRDSTIAWSYLSPTGVNPGAEGILDALGHLGGKRQEAQP